jgi:hypothetical protein
MANHTHDCEFCGEDRRSISNCCRQQIDKQNKDEEDDKKYRQAQSDLKAKYGINYSFSFEDLIRKLEKENDPFLKAIATEVALKKKKQQDIRDQCKHVWEDAFFYSICRKCGETSD